MGVKSGLSRRWRPGARQTEVKVKRKRADKRLERRLKFVRKIDGLKRILRQSLIMSGGRRENSAEHSWHLAVMVMLLHEYAAGKIDVGKAIRMALVHDIPETYAGDHFIYDARAQRRRVAREKAAAKRIFGFLPAGQAGEMRRLWEEYEENKSPEARFVRALDRLEPLICNCLTNGSAWRRHRVNARMVYDLNRAGMEFAPALWRYAEGILASAVRKGILKI